MVLGAGVRSKVSLNLEVLGIIVANMNRNYITVRELSRRLAISTRTAGRILRSLEGMGYVERYSNRAYRVIRPTPDQTAF